MNQWYDANFNSIKPPSGNNTYIYIQEPHTRTLKFYIYNQFKVIYKKIELPWFVFCLKNGRLFVAISKETPTLNSQLYDSGLPNFYGDEVCLDLMDSYYSIKKPQDYIDYFWQSGFSCYIEFVDTYCSRMKNKYFSQTNSNIKEMIERCQ